MKSVWETINGKKILLARYDHLTLDELRLEMKDVEKQVVSQPEGSVLLLINIVGTIITPESFTLFKDLASRTKKYPYKTAVIGISGARKTMLDIIVKVSGLAVAPFDTLEEAKAWLTKP
jgi:hypothetical protein